ncbi:MAG TPA: lytic transglycosylase domain-containing protein [Candidatus Polarisedimenticolia bacterium]
MRAAALLPVLAACALGAAEAGEEIYYRRDQNGSLVLTNVPDHRDLRTYSGQRPLAAAHSGEEFRDLIWKTSLQHGVRPELVYAVAAVESNFDPRAQSAKGALGLMQLMPETATRFGVSDPFDPVENVVGGVRYLRYLLDLFGGDQRLALAAYNAGENAVQTTRSIPPYQETRAYVAKVLKIFGRNQTPYAGPKSGVSASKPRTPMYSYTDDQGNVHYLDHPPSASERAPAAAPRPQ